MFNFTTKYGSSKGMVAVPNIIGQTTSQASATLANAGLVVGTSTSQNTTLIGQSGQILNQSVAAGELADYGQAINFEYYVYSVSVVSTTDTGCLVTATSYPYTCSGYTQYVSPVQTRSGTITKTFSDGSTQVTTYPCSDTYPTPYTVSNSSACGYVAPSCTPSTTVQWGTTCHSSGYLWGLEITTYSNCSTSSTQRYDGCCVLQLSTTYGTWGTCSCNKKYRTNYSPYYYCGTYYPNPVVEEGSCSSWNTTTCGPLPSSYTSSGSTTTTTTTTTSGGSGSTKSTLIAV